MFKASLKFQATEKQADSVKELSWAQKCSDSLYKGPSTALNTEMQTLEEVASQTGIQAWVLSFTQNPENVTTRGRQAKLFYPRKAQAEPRLHMKTRVP